MQEIKHNFGFIFEKLGQFIGKGKDNVYLIKTHFILEKYFPVIIETHFLLRIQRT